MDPAVERMLIDAATRNDTRAFDKLMCAHEEAVYRCAYAFTGSRETALDVAQNVFLKAFLGLPRFEGLSSFRTWILRITSNELLNQAKSGSRGRLVDAAALEELHDDSPGPERETISRDSVARVIPLIGRLSETQRMAILLRHFEELSLEEISAILGTTTDVAKNALYRAHRKLSDLWQEANHARPRL